MLRRPIEFTECYYPESDGKPMGETDEHRMAMIRHIELLQRYYAGKKVYISGDLLVYYEAGNPKKFVVPDAFIVKGADPGRRRIFRIWLEPHAPDVVIETTSRKTKKKDTNDKPDLYCRLGIKEYFLFDPLSEYLNPSLQGYRLVDGKYQPIEYGEGSSLVSLELKLILKPEDGKLQFYRCSNGRRLLTAEEARQRESRARKREEQARKREEAARLAAEEEVHQLRAELARKKPS
jgi:Uma2 family endonuclease